MIKIIKKHRLLSTIVIIAIATIFFAIKNNVLISRKLLIDTIVIRATENTCSPHSPKKNHVLMINDLWKIRQYSSLLLDNPQETDPCGDYDYYIQFWANSELYRELATDKDGSYFFFFPASVKRLLNEIDQQYQSATELVFHEYFLKIPVNHEPIELIAKLKKNNIQSFIERNLNWRYPLLKIKSKYAGEDNKKAEKIAIEEAETSLNQFLTSSNIAIIHKNEFKIDSRSYFQNRVDIESNNWLYFPLDTDLSTITPQLTQAGFTILKQHNPDYYYLTLVDKRDINEIRQFIKPICQDCLVVMERPNLSY